MSAVLTVLALTTGAGCSTDTAVPSVTEVVVPSGFPMPIPATGRVASSLEFDAAEGRTMVIRVESVQGDPSHLVDLYTEWMRERGHVVTTDEVEGHVVLTGVSPRVAV